MGLIDYFDLIKTTASTHTWSLVSHKPEILPIDALAKALAELIMRQRFISCPHHFEAWQLRTNGGPSHSSKIEAALKAFIKPTVGLPKKEIPINHLEGFVSEYLWYFLSLEMASGDIVKIEPPSFRVTEPGGDGLIIHRLSDGKLQFRLWEIKKCTGSNTVSSTIGNAYKQINNKATEYLAKYTMIGQENSDPELKAFYGKLVDYWIDSSPEAAAGVSVTIPKEKVPKRCFTTFGGRFPKLVDPVRLQGMINAIDDFSSFALKVREFIWNGL